MTDQINIPFEAPSAITFGDRVRAERERRGLSQAAFGQMLGSYHSAYISQAETGARKPGETFRAAFQAVLDGRLPEPRTPRKRKRKQQRAKKAATKNRPRVVTVPLPPALPPPVWTPPPVPKAPPAPPPPAPNAGAKSPTHVAMPPEEHAGHADRTIRALAYLAQLTPAGRRTVIAMAAARWPDEGIYQAPVEASGKLGDQEIRASTPGDWRGWLNFKARLRRLGGISKDEICDL